MYFNDNIIVLLRRHFRERDRMVSAYSLNHGRIVLRFPGVNKEASKLKAFSEPFVNSEVRIYFRTNASIGCATGGNLTSVYPNLRKNVRKTNLALHFCELMHRLTPEQSPNPNKFYLLENSLTELNNFKFNEAAAPAFLLRLMQLSGFGVAEKPLLNIPADFWTALHKDDLHNLAFNTAEEIIYLNKARYVCKRFLNKYLTYPLNTINELDLTIPLKEIGHNTQQEKQALTVLEEVLQPV
ncbi:MAG: DNA repair protein RecO [Elusimicrobiaceae bacterium]|nr:DNA repair protein RecO [Elusimicrobiaceae bacterium]